MAVLEEELAQKRAFAVSSLKEAQAFNRFITVEPIGIEKLSLKKQEIECLKVYYEGVYGYIPKTKIDDYEFHSIESFVNSDSLNVMIDDIISDEHHTFFIADREAALEVQASIFWKRGKKGDIIDAYVSGVDRVNVYLIVNGVRVRMRKDDFSYKYVRDLREVLERGQTLTVKVIEINTEEQKVRVSSRVLEGDPKVFLNEYVVGGSYSAVVNNIDHETGVFVALKPHGITALASLPPTRIGQHIKEGDRVNFKVTRMDTDKGFIYGRLIVPRAGQLGKAQRSR